MDAMVEAVVRTENDSAPWTIEGLIEAAERIMAAEPHLFSHPDSETGRNLNVRLIRDYVVREFIPRPERHGRESRFGREHLIWLLAVRGLLRSQRWSLPAIKNSFTRTSTEELLSGLLAPVGSRIDAEYRKAIRQLPGKTRAVEEVKTPELNPAQLLIEQFKSKKGSAVMEPAASLFRRGSPLSGTATKSAAIGALRAARSLQPPGSAKDKTHIEIEPWCEVVMDARRVRSLTSEEVEGIGEAIKSRLRSQLAR